MIKAARPSHRISHRCLVWTAAAISLAIAFTMVAVGLSRVADADDATSSSGASHPEVKFFCNFTSSPADCGFFEQARVGGRASLSNITRNGSPGVRLHTEPGDKNVFGSANAERNDLAISQAATDCYEGREHWWAHSVLFPDDYVDPPKSMGRDWNWGVVFDFHNSASGPWQANFAVTAMPATATSPDRPTGLWFRGFGGVKSGDGEFAAPIGPIVRNVWYDFVYHVRWSSGADGFFDAWVNGEKKMSHRGPTLYAGQGCYLKLANYHTAFGQPSSVIHARVIRGTTAQAVSLTPVR